MRQSIVLIPLCLYLGLALGGLNYGLPNPNHIQSYNCDEFTWLQAIAKMRPSQGNINPYPGLTLPSAYLELYGLLIVSAGVFGWIPLHEGPQWVHYGAGTITRLYLLGRWIQVFSGIFILLNLWLLGRRLFNTETGLYAALLMAVMPAFVAASHFSQANLPVAALSLLSLTVLLWNSSSESLQEKDLLLAALIAGLAISTKYSAGVLLAPLGWVLMQRKRSLALVLKTVSALGVGFFIGSPFTLLAPVTFWHAMLRQSQGMSHPSINLWATLVFAARFPFRFALGAPLACMVLAGLCHAAFRPSPVKKVILVFAGASYLAILGVGTFASPGRILFCLPPLLLLAAAELGTFAVDHPARKTIVRIGIAGLVLYTLLPSLAIVSLRRRLPLQITASNWIAQAIPSGSEIGILREPFWSTPDLLALAYRSPELFLKKYRVRNLHYHIPDASHPRPDFLIMSQSERITCVDTTRVVGNCDDINRWLDSQQDYILVKTFPRDVRFGAWHWDRPEMTGLTDDDLWASSILVYRRK